MCGQLNRINAKAVVRFICTAEIVQDLACASCCGSVARGVQPRLARLLPHLIYNWSGSIYEMINLRKVSDAEDKSQTYVRCFCSNTQTRLSFVCWWFARPKAASSSQKSHINFQSPVIS